MRSIIVLTSVILLLLFINACGQVSNNQTTTDKLIGKWKAADSTSFREKEIEFLPDHQVTLILANGGKQNGQYEVNGNIITFSIGDALPFNMNFRIEDGNLFLSASGEVPETKYIKPND
jgi:hypothetical protein